MSSKAFTSPQDRWKLTLQDIGTDLELVLNSKVFLNSEFYGIYRYVINVSDSSLAWIEKKEVDLNGFDLPFLLTLQDAVQQDT